MINLMKMNGIRMFHSKLFYVMMILCFGIFLFFIFYSNGTVWPKIWLK